MITQSNIARISIEAGKKRTAASVMASSSESTQGQGPGAKSSSLTRTDQQRQCDDEGLWDG